jgi:hypothetical protein
MTQAIIDAYRTLAYTGISSTFAVVGSPLAHAWRIFCITNTTNGDMIFSVDGTTLNVFVPAASFKLIDLGSDASSTNFDDNMTLPIATQWYVKSSASLTDGAVYIEGFYAKGE